MFIYFSVTLPGLESSGVVDLYVIQSITSNVVPVFACADFPPRPCFIDELMGCRAATSHSTTLYRNVSLRCFLRSCSV
jgi:hypothetical protein